MSCNTFRALERLFKGFKVSTTAEIGIDPDAKEVSCTSKRVHAVCCVLCVFCVCCVLCAVFCVCAVCAVCCVCVCVHSLIYECYCVATDCRLSALLCLVTKRGEDDQPTCPVSIWAQ